MSARVSTCCLIVGAAIGCAGWSAEATAPAISPGSSETQVQPEQGDGRLALMMPVKSELSLALAGIKTTLESCSDDFDLPIDLILYVDPEEAWAYDLETRIGSHAVLVDMATCFEDVKVATGENVSDCTRRRRWALIIH